MKRKYWQVPLTFAFLSVTAVGMQNCGSFEAPGSDSKDDANSAPSTAVAPTALECTNADALKSNTKISVAQQLSANGRLGSDSIVFLNKQGQLFFASSVSPDPIPVDVGISYKWIDNSGTYPYCGITTDDKVRCRRSTLTYSEVPALAGSAQATGYGANIVLALKPDGSLVKYNFITVTAMTPPEKIILLGHYVAYGASGKSYAYGELVNGTPSAYDFPHDELVSDIKADGLTPVKFCGQRIIASAHYANSSYAGCALTESGKIICTNMDASILPNGALKSIDRDGNFSNEMASIDPDNQYLAISRFSSNFICAIRSDLETVCFTNGFKSAFPMIEQKFTPPSILTKAIFNLTTPTDIVKAKVAVKKTCVLYANKDAICWKTPSYDPVTGVTNLPYLMKSTQVLKSVVGTVSGASARACALGADGALLCELTENLGTEDLVDIDPGAKYSWFSTRLSSKYGQVCGLTLDGKIRCAGQLSDTTKPYAFVDKLTDVAFTSNEFMLMKNGCFFSLTEDVTATCDATHTTTAIFQSAVAGHEGLYYDTSGKIRTISNGGAREVSAADFTLISGFKNTGIYSYVDLATSKCYFVNGYNGLGRPDAPVNEVSCTNGTSMTASSTNGYVFNSLYDYLSVRADGVAFGSYDSNELHFIKPFVIP